MKSEGVLHRLGRSEAASGLAMISPTAIYAILLLGAPLALIFLYSFMTDGYLEIIRTFTFANYIEAWTNELYRVVMLRSLFVSMTVTAVTVLLAFPVAYFVSFHVDPSRKSLWLLIQSSASGCSGSPVDRPWTVSIRSSTDCCTIRWVS